MRTNDKAAQESFLAEKERILNEINKLRAIDKSALNNKQLDELERILTTSTEYGDMFK